MRSRAFERYPEYRIEVEPLDGRLCITVAGRCVADTRRALVLRESDHEPVYYVPFEDVRREWLEPSSRQTHCPFKGDASYWSLRVGDQYRENAVWAYEDPYDEVAGLRRHLAFYPDRVDGFWLDGERVAVPR
jgi:uncharacterized protein (DUF427 family)